MGELILSTWNIAKVNPLKCSRQEKYAFAEASIGLTGSEIVSKLVAHRVVVGTDFDPDVSPLPRDFECPENREQFTRTSCHIRVSFRDFFYDWPTTLRADALLHDDRYTRNFSDGIVRGVDSQGLNPFGHGCY